ncbi:hypothetical protein PACTADRAFT_45956 [Pachysolen tannophilus NRRL Y-2460]|uniref:GST C-terminal domain-containing protein n=1 Tax=Pachysolen tannophilus NRRL Y-2460 TaxID=669874 RepID=A0A1E4TPT0_PACTA|nr:hypothetical protein PACTADRAFT_45956 [Pachysolen tannophilus NRRL Y-2460]
MTPVEKKQKIEIQKFAGEDGQYKRRASVFRDFISSKPGSQFLAEANRYHLYVSYACPWATRCLIVRSLKGLSSIISLSVVHWHMDSEGWRFPSDDDKCKDATIDHIYGFKRIKQLYFKANENYDGRFTVPVLWDKKLHTIVNNESSEIIRMLNSEFNHLIDDEHKKKLNLYPTELQKQIDELNSWVYDNINNGVYKTGFATKQEIYENEVLNVFKYLDKAELILKENFTKGETYLIGNQLTEADVRLFVTIIRFDPVYVQHFKCNIGMIRHDFPNIHKWMRLLFWTNASFKETTNFDHIKFHYTKSHKYINPHGITPLGPIPNILPLDHS